MKDIKNSLQINEAELCKPNDICYKVLNKVGNQICVYLPYAGYGEGAELKQYAEAMAKTHNGKVIEVKFKEINK